MRYWGTDLRNWDICWPRKGGCVKSKSHPHEEERAYDKQSYPCEHAPIGLGLGEPNLHQAVAENERTHDEQDDEYEWRKPIRHVGHSSLSPLVVSPERRVMLGDVRYPSCERPTAMGGAKA